MRILGIKDAKINDTALEVHFDNEKLVTFEDCWLRDHCRCSECFVTNTNLRANHLLELSDATLKSVSVNGSELQVTWSDNHESVYDAEFLIEFDLKTWVDRRRIHPVLWRGDEIATKVGRISADKFLNTKQGAKIIFQSILDYGVAFIDQVEPTLEATAVVSEGLGGIQKTLFGDMWDIKVDESLNDTAFMSIALPQHTDLSSFTDPAGLQLLHSLEHTNGQGGETVLVDGFYAAAKLKEEHPKDYEFLTKFPVEAEYKFNGHSFRHGAPAIELDMITQDVRQVRFNSFDRSPMAFANGEDCRAYYRSLKHFAEYIENKKNHWQFKLQPGVVMVFDNFRLLHGRTGFTGKRVLGGTYVSRTNWMDKARALGSDDHESTYDVEFLSQFDYEKWSESRRTKPYPWRGTDIVEKVAKVPVNKFLNTDEGAKAVFQSLLSYGVAFIDGVEPTLASTEVVCRAMGGIQHTLFGGMWEIRPEPGVNDTAYMNVGLPQHTDLSSFTEPAGLQVFHCLQHDGTGGESVISDGFYAANKLKESHREDYNFLTTFDAEAEYVFNDHHFRYSAPMIELDNFGDLKQIRFNTYDRSSIAFKNGDQCNAYYQALRNFAKIIEDPKNHWQFKLKPGLVMVFDNFRALHGRTEFTGMRVIAGSYVARTDWLDRARTLKLIK
ncbi:unnamed protein product [Leptosia nina]|uniref:Trimethyllysine dioxygenase, mitochondrial n=1 Tax=Leptosia nina TaxID=320188 RepID=A0AAV1JTA4_9NEOP